MIKQIKSGLRRIIFRERLIASETAYDLWAATYDHQPGNLMIDLDEEVFCALLEQADLKGKVIADIGCGTGRHWPKLFAAQPARLSGYDVSGAMLNALKAKYPQSQVVKLNASLQPAIAPMSLDIIISTLTIAHINDLDTTINTWCDALKTESTVIITDFHPDALAAGGKRTFNHQQQQIAIKNFVHPVSEIVAGFEQHGFKVIAKEERCVDERVRHYYEAKSAMHVYNRFKGHAIIYGLCLRRSGHATAEC